MRSPPSAAVVVVVVVMMVMGLDAEDVLRLTHRQLCFRNIGTSTYASFGDVADLEDGPPLGLVHQSGSSLWWEQETGGSSTPPMTSSTFASSFPPQPLPSSVAFHF